MSMRCCFKNINTYEKFVTHTMSVVGRIKGAGSHWCHMAKLKKFVKAPARTVINAPPF